MTCECRRLLSIGAKCGDRCTVIWPDDSQNADYAPYIDGLCSGAYIDLQVCIDCGKLVGLASADSILDTQIEHQGDNNGP